MGTTCVPVDEWWRGEDNEAVAGVRAFLIGSERVAAAQPHSILRDAYLKVTGGL